MNKQQPVSFREDYRRELEQKTLRVGFVSAVIGALASAAFYHLDQADLHLAGTLPWRAIGVGGGLLFLLSRLIKPLKKYTVVLHAVQLLGYLVMMSGIGYLVFSNPESTQKQLFALTAGFLSVWIIESLIAQGARKIMMYAAGMLLIIITILYATNSNSVADNAGYIFSNFMVGVFAILTMRNQERYEFERAYNMHMLELSRDRVRRQAADLQAKNENLIMFTRAMSHDLQGPLRRVRSFLDLYIFRSSKKLPAETKEYLDLAIQHLDQGQKVVHDLLIYAKIGQNELEKEAVDLNTLCEQIIGEQLPEEEQRKNMEIEYDLGQTIFGDEKLLWYLFSNLLSNAIKFSSKQEKPKVSVRSEETAGETVVVVADNGVGFDESFLEELGRPFKRFHGTEYAGTGIGLSIVTQIMKMHQGRFWAESPPGEGARFYCAFPHGPQVVKK